MPLVIAVPALAVALFWITFGWGWRVSLPLGIAIIILASAGFLIWRRRSPQSGR